jgi:hypothetical protein
VAVGGGVAFVGLIIGSTMSDHMVAVSIARALVIIGMVIGLLGFLPAAAVFMFARRIYNLMFHTVHAVTAMFADAESVNIPERLRQQLEAMLEAVLLLVQLRKKRFFTKKQRLGVIFITLQNNSRRI